MSISAHHRRRWRRVSLVDCLAEDIGGCTVGGELAAGVLF